MLNIEKIDQELYIARYGLPRIGDANIIWARIKDNTEVLREAVKVRRNRRNTENIVNGLAISDAMLIDYRCVDQVAYSELIKSIYTNKDIARLVIGGVSNIGYTFLLMSLWNHSLKLTEEQKAFAVSEVNTAVHGIGVFDIRYYILRNPNWTLEEKQKLIMDFWDNDEIYDEYLEQWEWSVVNDDENYKGQSFPPFDIYELFNEWSYDMLLEYYGNKETTDRIWEEIEFCKQMHKLRRPQWESLPLILS